MTLTDAEMRAILETAAGRPRQVQTAEGMVTQYSASDLIALARFVMEQNAKDHAGYGLGFKRFTPPGARNRISTSTD